MNIDIKELENIKDKLERLSYDDVLFVDEDGKNKYVIMPVDIYDAIEDTMSLLNSSNPQVRIANPEDIELSYDEYERVKQQILDAVEKTLMPKPEKLN